MRACIGGCAGRGVRGGWKDVHGRDRWWEYSGPRARPAARENRIQVLAIGASWTRSASEGWSFHFHHALVTDAAITVKAKIDGRWKVVGSAIAAATDAPMTDISGSWTRDMPAGETIVSSLVTYNGSNYQFRALKPAADG